jgi:hypothetical protein
VISGCGAILLRANGDVNRVLDSLWRSEGIAMVIPRRAAAAYVWSNTGALGSHIGDATDRD